MGKIMGKLKHTFNAIPDLKLSFFTNNASFGHFYKVSMISITICTFYKFQVDSATINNEQKSYNKR